MNEEKKNGLPGNGIDDTSSDTAEILIPSPPSRTVNGYEIIPYDESDEEFDFSGFSDEELADIAAGRISYNDFVNRDEPIPPPTSPADIPITMSEEQNVYAPVPTVKKKNGKKFVLFILILVCVAAAVAIIAGVFLNGDDVPVANPDEYAVLYSKSGNMQLASYLSKNKMSGNDESIVKFSEDRKVFCFSTDSSKGTELVDLYYCDVRSETEPADGGVLIDTGVKTDFFISCDGKFIIYTKAAERSNITYCYTVKNNSPVQIDEEISEIFVSSHENTIFFTKAAGSYFKVLRCQLGEAAEQLFEKASSTHFFESDTDSEILVEQPTEEKGVVTLTSVNCSDEPKKLVDDAEIVLYDNYVCGENLYYLKASEAAEGETVSYAISDLITDDKAEADALLTAPPNKEDYLLTTIFGIKTYNLLSYNLAVTEYENKLARDEIRAALQDSVESTAAETEQHACYAYDGNQTTLVCEAVQQSGIVSTNPTGTPIVIFTHYSVTADATVSPITIDQAVEASKQYSGELNEYLKSLISTTGTLVPDGLAISVNNSNGTTDSATIDEYTAENTQFMFTDDGAAVLVLVKDSVGNKSTLYSFKTSVFGLAEKVSVDSNITDLIAAKNGYYYLKIDAGKENGSLYYYDHSSSQKLVSTVQSVINCGDGNLLAIHKPNGAVASLSICENNEVMHIDDGVDITHLFYGYSKCIAYLKNYQSGAGDMYLYNGGASPVLIDSAVSKIFAS